MPASARLSDVATSAHSLFSPSCAVDEDSDEPNMQRQHSDPTHDEHFVDVVVAEHSVLVSVESWVVVVVVVVVVVLTFFDEVSCCLLVRVVCCCCCCCVMREERERDMNACGLKDGAAVCLFFHFSSFDVRTYI